MTTHQPSPAHVSETPVVPARAPQAFLIVSLISLVLGMGMLVGQTSILLSSTLTNYGTAWIDLMIYGCIFSGAFGLCYRALPLVFDTTLFSRKLVGVHLVFHILGTALILENLLGPGLTSTSTGSVLVFCGALIFAANVGLPLHRIAMPDASTAFLGTALLWLVLVVSQGVPIATEPPLALFLTNGWSAGWIVLAVAGVALNVVFGITLRATPLALGYEPTPSLAAWNAFGFTNIGLAWLATALALAPLPAVIICASIYLIGSLIYLALLVGSIQRRQTRVLPWDLKFLLLSISLLFAPVSFLSYVAWQRMNIVPPDPESLEVVDAASATVQPLEFFPGDGAILLTLMLAIAVPAIVAIMFQFRSLETRTAPASQESTFRDHLGSQILLSSFFNYAVGVMMVIPAAWAGIERIVNLGTLFLLVGAAGFLGNYFYFGRSVAPKSVSLAAGNAPGRESKA